MYKIEIVKLMIQQICINIIYCIFFFVKVILIFIIICDNYLIIRYLQKLKVFMQLIWFI